MTSRTLWCLLHGNSEPFSVDIEPKISVDKLKDTIKARFANSLGGVDALYLKLWMLNTPVPVDDANTFHEQLQNPTELAKLAVQLKPAQKLSGLSLINALDDHITVIVEYPRVAQSVILTTAGDSSGIGSKRTRDITADIRKDWSKKLKTGLPPVDELANMLDNDLDAGIKVPLNQAQFDSLISTSPTDPCSSDDVSMVFRFSETETTPYSAPFTWAVIVPTPPSDGTETSFIPFWDLNIGSVIKILIREGKIIRNSNQGTKIGPKRPDFGFLIKGACPFRGEEKAPTNPESAKLELSQKLDWDYPLTEYIFGYHASGPLISLVAIYRPSDGSAKSKVLNIGSANLEYRVERISNLRRLINLSYLISELADRIAEDGIPEFRPINRGDKTIEKVGKGIVKTFGGAAGKLQVAHLNVVYQLMKEKGVPNVDRLALSSPDSLEGPQVYLEPRGIDRKPRDATEVIQAVSCILEALQVMHAEPKQIFHRDIRWPNIVMRRDDPAKWLLIDFDDAVSPPTHAAHHLASEYHSPRVFEDNHGGEVDIWAVGQLLLESSGWFEIASGISRRMTEIGEQMKKEKKMTAVMALALVASLS